jgi:hypothetical protein
MITVPYISPTVKFRRNVIMDNGNAQEADCKALRERDFASSKYGAQERIQVAVAFIVEGNVSRTSRVTGIPESTIRDWRKSDWWEQLATEVRGEKEREFQAGFTRMVQAAIGQVEDRLTHGDVKLVRGAEGHEERRVPVSAKDATMVAAISYDKLRLSLNLPTSIRSNTDAHTLESLAKRFEEIGRANQREVIDVTPMTGKVSAPSES